MAVKTPVLYPAPVMTKMARKLAEWGVDSLVISCNTVHHYYSQVASVVKFLIQNMIELTTLDLDVKLYNPSQVSADTIVHIPK